MMLLPRDKLSAVKADIEGVEKETGENMHTLVQMDRWVVISGTDPFHFDTFWILGSVS